MAGTFVSLLQQLQQVHDAEILSLISRASALAGQLAVDLDVSQDKQKNQLQFHVRLMETCISGPKTPPTFPPIQASEVPLPKTIPRPQAPDVPVYLSLPSPRAHSKLPSPRDHSVRIMEEALPVKRRAHLSENMNVSLSLAPTDGSQTCSIGCRQWSEMRADPTGSCTSVRAHKTLREAGHSAQTEVRCSDITIATQFPQQFPSTDFERELNALEKRKFLTMMATEMRRIDDHSRCHKTRSILGKLIMHPQFETFFAVLISMNAFVMCLQAQYSGLQLGHELDYPDHVDPAADIWPRADGILDVLEFMFGAIFTLEVSLKLVILSMEFFRQVFNYIDLAVVIIFLSEYIGGSLVPIKPQTLQLFRIVRLGRLVRLIRTIEACDALYLIVTSIKGSARILGWALILFVVIQMSIALLMTQLLHATYFQRRSPGNEANQLLFEKFGTFTRSMFSMFELTFANWPPICRLLAENVSEWFMLFCVIHKLTVGFAVVNVVTGVFLQETFKIASTDDCLMKRNKVKQVKAHQTKMQRLFNALDESADGQIDVEEFENMLGKHPEVKTWLASMDLDLDHWTLESIFWLIDKDKDGFITMDELCEGVAHLRGPAKSLDVVSWFHRLRNEIKADLDAAVPVQSTHNLESKPGSAYRSKSVAQRHSKTA